MKQHNVWPVWFGNIDCKKWVKQYHVKQGNLFETLKLHIVAIYNDVYGRELEEVAHSLETEVREVMGWE